MRFSSSFMARWIPPRALGFKGTCDYLPGEILALALQAAANKLERGPRAQLPPKRRRGGAWVFCRGRRGEFGWIIAPVSRAVLLRSFATHPADGGTEIPRTFAPLFQAWVEHDLRSRLDSPRGTRKRRAIADYQWNRSWFAEG